MIRKLCSILRAAYLLPFSVLMGNIAAAEGVAEMVSEDVPLSPEEQAHAEAVARGDVIEPPKEEIISPEILAEVAEGVQSPVVEEKKDDGTIPRPRFNEVLAENKQLKAQLDALRQPPTGEIDDSLQQPDPKVVEDPRDKIKELRRQQKDLELEGDIEAASQVGDQIDDLILEVATNRAQSSLKQENQITRVQQSMDEIATAAYEKYPFLDINSSDVDEDAVNAVIIRRNELAASGMSLVEALGTAIDEKGPKFARLLGISPQAKTAEQIRAERDKAAREKASEASLNQPAELPSKTEKESFAVNVEDLTPAQIKAMPEEQKAKLRGDIP